MNPRAQPISAEAVAAPRRPVTHLPVVAADVPFRPRLVELLEQSVAESSLVLVIASEGMGKTTAAAQWSRKHTGRAVVWVDAGESGADGWEFYTLLVEELAATAQLPEAESYLDGVRAPRPLARMGASLSRHLQRAHTEAVVVVDQAEVLSAEALSLIRLLARRGPLRFVLLARHLDQDFLFDSQTELQSPILDDSHLQLTEGEVEAALQHAGLQLEANLTDVRALMPMLLRSVVFHARQRNEDRISEQTFKHLRQKLSMRSLRRVLAEGALTEDQGAVLRLFVAPIVDQQLAATLLGADTWTAQQTLRRLHNTGAGEYAPDGFFRIDAALAPGFRELAVERLDDHQLRITYAQIAEWYVQHGKVRDALQFATEADAWQLIAELTLLHFGQLYQVAPEQLQQTIDRVPLDQIRIFPHLGWIRMQLLADRSDTTLATLTAVGDQVLSVLDAEAQGPLALSNDVVVFGYHRMRGDFSAADELIEGLLLRFEELGASVFMDAIAEGQQFMVEAVRSWSARALRQYAASTKLFMGHHELALGLIEPSVQPLTDGTGKIDWRNLYSAGLKALIHASAGNISAAERVLRWVYSEALPPAWEESFFGAPACIASAYVSMAQQRPETAAAELDRVNHFQGATELWAFILDIRARIALYFKEAGMVSYIVAELGARASRPPTSRYMQVQLLSRAAAVAMTAGALPAAAKYLDQARDRDYPMRPGFSIERVAGVLAIYHQDWLTARDIARDILNADSSTLREEISMRICLVQAEMGLVTEGHPEAEPQAVGWEFLAALALADEAGSPYDLLLIPAEQLKVLLRQHAAHRRDIWEQMQRTSGQPATQPIPAVSLTEAEKRVLNELRDTSSRAVIAQRLTLSENTVKTHLRRLYRKLGVSSRAEALERAYAAGHLARG